MLAPVKVKERFSPHDFSLPGTGDKLLLIAPK